MYVDGLAYVHVFVGIPACCGASQKEESLYHMLLCFCWVIPIVHYYKHCVGREEDGKCRQALTLSDTRTHTNVPSGKDMLRTLKNTEAHTLHTLTHAHVLIS